MSVRFAAIPRYRRAALAACAMAAALASPTPLGAPAQVERPASARRVVRIFDFEERDVNFEDAPMFWVRAVHNPPIRERPGFPSWNKAAFDDTAAVSGRYSVKLPTRGGSASLRLSAGVVPAIPGADYILTAKVRTDSLLHARARLSARFLDAQHQPVPGSESRGPLTITDGAWKETRLELPGRSDDSAWIQIDLELLQPDQYRAHEPDRHDVTLEDVSGAAWFDDVTILQLPRVTLKTASPGNVIVSPEEPQLITTVHDLTGERLKGRVAVFDIDGREIDRRAFDVPAGGRPAAWRPGLPAHGWYRAELQVSNDDRIVSRRAIDFVWSPARLRPVSSEADRFGLVLERLHPAHRRDLPEVVRRIGAGALHLSVEAAAPPSASADDPIASAARKDAADMMESLLEGHAVITLTLAGDDRTESRPPSSTSPGVARSLQTSGNSASADESAFAMLSDAGTLSPQFQDVVTRYGQRVRHWQIGLTGSDLAMWMRGLQDGVEAARASLSRLAPEPVVALPWSATIAIDPAIAERAAITASLPFSIQPEGIHHFSDLWPDGADITLVLKPLPAEVFGRRAAAIDLVKRVVQAWRIQPSAIAIDRPWSASADGVPQFMPAPELAVMRQLIERLAGRRVVAILPTAAGVTGLVLEGADLDAVVAWSDFAEPRDAVIRAYLAEGPVRVLDPFGNETTVVPEHGLHRIQLSETPVFVEGVDVHLARFRAGFHIEPPFVSSTAEKHELSLVLENPWPQGITGRLRIVAPEHWRIAPRVHTFSIEAGRTERLPFEASFGVGEEAGTTPMQIDVELTADRRYPPVRLSPTIEIGLPYVQLGPSLRIEPGKNGAPGDLVVTLVITNTGDHPLTMQAFALAPGFAREQVPVSDLRPAQTIVKRFVFKGGAESLRAQEIRVGLIETDGLGRLNKTMIVP